MVAASEQAKFSCIHNLLYYTRGYVTGAAGENAPMSVQP